MLDKNYKIVEANLIEKLMASEKKVRHLQASIDSVIQECQYFIKSNWITTRIN